MVLVGHAITLELLTKGGLFTHSHYNLDSNDDYFPSGSYMRKKKYMKNQQWNCSNENEI